ncbi:MAG: hypothetical protein RIB84_23775 [Sneathiellaceae bacterium]
MPHTTTDETIDRAWRELDPAILALATPPPGLAAQAVARLRPEIAARIREIVREGEGATLTEQDLARLGLTAADTEAMRDLILAEARKANAARREA